MITSGSLIEFQVAKRESLDRVIIRYSSRGLTGYIVYSSRRIHIIIGLVEGSIASCRAITYTSTWRRLLGLREYKKIIDGAECAELTVRYLRDKSGVISVYESNRDAVIVNISNTPTARVEANVGFIGLLGLKAGLAKTSLEAIDVKLERSKSLERPGPQSPERPPIEPISSTPTVETQPLEEPIRREKTHSASTSEEPVVSSKPTISSECIDPMLLFSFMKTSEVVETLDSIEVDRALDMLMLISNIRKTNLVYGRGYIDDSLVRMLYNAQANTIYLEVEQAGEVKCGTIALETLRDKRASQLSIMASQY